MGLINLINDNPILERDLIDFLDCKLNGFLFIGDVYENKDVFSFNVQLSAENGSVEIPDYVRIVNVEMFQACSASVFFRIEVKKEFLLKEKFLSTAYLSSKEKTAMS